MTYEERVKPRMSALAYTFPTMRMRWSDAARLGLEPWDVRKLATLMCGTTGAEKLVVSFLAHVWGAGSTIDEIPAFDVFEAYARWDAEHWKAFQAWVREPFCC